MTENKEYASKGVAGTALGLGIAGTVGLLSGNNGCGGNGILGGILGGGHNDCYVSQKENDLSIALAVAQSEKYTSEKANTQLERLFAEIRREDDKLESLTASVAAGVIATSKEIGILQADVKCLQREVDRNREEGARNFRESKEYTDTAVTALGKQATCEIEKAYLWVKAQNYVPSIPKIDPNQICGVSPLACNTCLG